MERNRRNRFKDRLMYSTRTQTIVLVFLMLFIFFVLSTGYSVLNAVFGIDTNVEIRPEKDIRITRIDGPTTTNGAYENGNYQYSHDLFIAKGVLPNSNSTISYTITFTNNGNTDKTLDNIVSELNGDINYTVEGLQIGDEVLVGESKTITITFHNNGSNSVTYSAEFTFELSNSYVDITSPTITFNPEADSVWGNQNKTVVLSATDDRTIVEFKYCTTTSSSCTPTIDANIEGTNITLSNEGKHVICATATDNAKNPNTTTICSNSTGNYYQIDKTAPVMTVEDNTTNYTKRVSVGTSFVIPTAVVTDNSGESIAAVTSGTVNPQIEGTYTITYTATDPAGNKTTLVLTVEVYLPMLQSWTSSATTDFHNESYRLNIISAEILTDNTVPNNATASWDVSKNKDGSVMAWVITDTTDTTKYHLYIGGDGSIYANTNSSYLFYDFKNIESIVLGDLNTSKTTTMSYMFKIYNTSSFSNGTIYTKLTSLDVSKFDTSNVRNMSYMFDFCDSVTEIKGIENFNTTKVELMISMFHKCNNWIGANLSDWNTSSVTNMSDMFSIAGLTSTTFNIGDISNWDTSSVINMSDMFHSAGYRATTFDIGNLSSWDTSSVTDMSSMFSSAGQNATTFNIGDLSNWDTSSVKYMSNMFQFAGYSATTFDIGNLSNWNTSKVTSMAGMFYSAGRSATTFDIGDLSGWNTSSVTNMSYMFCQVGYKATTFNIGDISNWNTLSVTDMSNMFYMAASNAITSLDLSGWDASNVTDMGYMFNGITALETIKTPKNIQSSVTLTNITNKTFWDITDNDAEYAAGTFPVGNGNVSHTLTSIQPVKYNVTLHYEDGITSSETVQASRTSQLPTPTREGYDFNGWWTGTPSTIQKLTFSNPNADYSWTQDSNGVWSSGNAGVNSSTSDMISNEFTIVSDETLSFEWRSNGENYYDYLAYDIYDVTNDKYLSGITSPTHENGLENLKGAASTSYSTVSYELPAGTYQVLFMYGKDSSDYDNEDKGFVKNIKLGSDAIYNTQIEGLIIEDIEALAKWVPTSYTINYELNGGILAEGAITNYTIEDEVSLPIANKNDLISEWYETEDFSGDPVTTIPVGTTGNKTYYAKYVEAPYYWAVIGGNGGGAAPVSVFIAAQPDPAEESIEGLVITNASIVGDLPDCSSGGGGSEASEFSISTENACIIASGTFKRDEVFTEETVPWRDYNYDISQIRVIDITGAGIKPTSTAYWFNNMTEVNSIDLSDLDTSKTETMQGMFKNFDAQNIGDSLDLSMLDASNVTDMSYMFAKTQVNSIKTPLNIRNDVDLTGITSIEYYDHSDSNTKYAAGTFPTGNGNTSHIMKVKEYYWGIDASNKLIISDEPVESATESRAGSFAKTSKFTTNYNLTTAPWGTYADAITSIEVTKVNEKVSPISTANWFSKLMNVTDVDVTNLDTSSVIDMSGMFRLTGYNVTNSFEITGMENWNTSKVTDMSYMFQNAGYNATTFTITGMENWNTSNVTTMYSMFNNAGINAITELDLSGWDASNVTDIANMFYGISTLETIKTPKNIPSNVHSYGITDKTFWDVTDNDKEYSKGTFPKGNGDTSHTLTTVDHLYYWGIDASNKLIISDVPVTTATSNRAGSFAKTAVFGTTGSGTSRVTSAPWKTYATTITSIEVTKVNKIVAPTSLYGWFAGLKNVTSIDVTNLDTSNVTSMLYTFYYTGYNVTNSFTITGMENWNTSKVNRMDAMFTYAGYNAKTWSIGDISNWNTSKVTYMSSMFQYAGRNAITELDLSGWDASNVTDMSYMFYGINKLETIKTPKNIQNSVALTSITSKTFYDADAGTKYAAGTFPVGNGSTSHTLTIINPNAYYWGIDASNKLIISDEPVTTATSNRAGSFEKTDNLGYTGGGESALTNAPWGTYAAAITSIEVTKVNKNVAPTSLHGWFTGLRNVTTIDVTNLDTSSVTNMSSMFSYAGSNVTTFTVTGLNTWNTSNVTDMSGMFLYAGRNATTWNIGDLSNWNTSSVTNMADMFYDAGYKATTFTITGMDNWNTSKVTNMSYMFNYAGRNATTWNIGDLSNWNTSSVTNMSHMFYDAGYNATTWAIGDLSTKTVTVNGKTYTAWDVSNVTNMSAMFLLAGQNATTWNIGDVSNWDTSSVTNMSGTFSYAGNKSATWSIGDLSTKTVTVNGKTYTAWDVSNVTDMSGMFLYAGRIATTWSIGDLSNWNTSSVTTMSQMFYFAGRHATTWNIGDLSNWNTSSVTNMATMFYNAGYNATTWNIGDLSTKTVTVNGKTYTAWDVSNVTNMSQMFSSAGQNATTWSIGDLSNWNTSKATNMSSMFEYAGYNATTWSIGDLSNWDTSSVTNMQFMFQYAGCNATTWNIGDLSNWDTSKVTDMRRMFEYAGCNATTFTITGMDNWNTSNVTNMLYMFSFAGSNATTWDIGDLSTKTVTVNGKTYTAWDVSNVTDMSGMFTNAGRNATTFTITGLNTWNTSKATNMSSMFEYAGYNATTWSIGDLSNWDTSSVTNMSAMFSYAGNKSATWSIGDLSNWDTSSVTNMSAMFSYAGNKSAIWSIGDLSNWDTSSVTDMWNMFYHAGINAITELDLSGWDATNVTNMSNMFSGINTLETIKTPKNIQSSVSKSSITDKTFWDLTDNNKEYAAGTFPVGNGNVSHTLTSIEPSYSITYQLDNGTLPSDAIKSYKKSVGLSSLPTPTKEGYEFAGWYESADFSGDAITSIAAGTTGDITLYAKWTIAEACAVGTYVNQSFSITTSETSVSGATFNAVRPTTLYLKYHVGVRDPEGAGSGQYPLIRVEGLVEGTTDTWVTLYSEWKAGASSEISYDGNVSITTDSYITKLRVVCPNRANISTHTVKIVGWCDRKYNITYELDGGTLESDAPTYYIPSVGVSALPIPTKTNYLFEGWYTTSDLSGTSVTSIAAGTKGNITLYSKYVDMGSFVLKSGIHSMSTRTINGFGATVGTRPQCAFDGSTSTYVYSYNSNVDTAEARFGETVKVKEITLMAGSGGALNSKAYYIQPDGTKVYITSGTVSAGQSIVWTADTYVEAIGIGITPFTKSSQYLASIHCSKWYELSG